MANDPTETSRRSFLKGLAATIAGGVVLGGGAAALGRSLATAPAFSHFLVAFRKDIPHQDLENHDITLCEAHVDLARLVTEAIEETARGRPIVWRCRPEVVWEDDRARQVVVMVARARGVVVDDESLRDTDISPPDESDPLLAGFGTAQVKS